MKTLYLMCGNSFSGKSTLAAAIVRKLSGALVSLDEINRERGLGFGGDGIAVEEWERTHQVAIVRIEEYMRAGRDIVQDDTNCFRWLRDRYRAVADRHGYRTVVVYLDVPLPILQERRRQNESTRERRAVQEPIFAELTAKFEAPAPDEPTLAFAPTDTIEEWIEAHLKNDSL